MRLRAILLGLVLAVIICAVTPFNNAYLQGTPLAGGHFPLAPFFLVLCLTVILAGLGKVLKKTWLTGRELLVTWVLMVLVSGIAYTGLVRTFFHNLTVPYHFATVGNRWGEVLQPLLPKAWFPQNEAAIKLLYNGLQGGRQMSWLKVLQGIPWEAWITPLLVWTVFILLCYFVMICLVSLLSRQWLQNERMNFPLLQVPMIMEEAVDQRGLAGFFSDAFLLTGLALPVLLHLLNGLHFYYPTIPEVPTLILAGSYFPKYGLFSSFHKLKLYFYPAFIGFAFLTSRQISFSFWFLFFAGGLFIGLLGVLGYNIPAAALGVTFGPTLSRPEETQMIGAYLVFFLFILWLARHHLLEVIKQAFGLAKAEVSEAEWVSARSSFWGLVLGGLALLFWANYFGMPWLVSLAVIGSFFLVMLVASRVICQGGLAYFTLTAAPIDGLLAFFGPKFFTHVGLVVAGITQKVLFVDLRESLMPSLFHAGKVSQGVGGKRLILSGILITLLLGVAVSFLAMLALGYKFGLRELQMDWATSSTIRISENVFTLIESPPQSSYWVEVFSVAGGAIMLALIVCYHQFPWWPIHPVGYLTAYSSAMRLLWFSFFLGWLANSLCMRYGGVSLFKRLRYFFVGLIIGDFLMGGFWAVVGLFGRGCYVVFPS
ncbi:MAG: DUF6785 family protein [Pseudomonadota bacterium]